MAIAVVLTACCPRHPAYQEQYAYLKPRFPYCAAMRESDYFLVILVEARHLDYSDNLSLLRTLVKHPSDGSKNSDVGHAWIYLQGIENGERVYVEGGHSGELGVVQAKYFEGVMNGLEFGSANPSSEQLKNPTYEPNPIRYLWATQKDGFFQEGAGRHSPTFAAKVDLTEEQFQLILSYIQSYPYRDYSLSGNQCSTFVTQVAALGGLELESEITIALQSEVILGSQHLRLWEDPCFSTFTFSTPDVVEKSLMQAVREGRAEYALDWVRRHRPMPFADRWQIWRDNIMLFPERMERVILFQYVP